MPEPNYIVKPVYKGGYAKIGLVRSHTLKQP